MDGVYLTWLISALAIGVLLMPLIKPPWAKVTSDGFIDFFEDIGCISQSYLSSITPRIS